MFADLRAAVPGALPTVDTPTVGGVELPRGHLVTPDPGMSPTATGATGPVLWMTDEVVRSPGALWIRLQRKFTSTGLWPLLLSGFRSDAGRPWEVGELDPASVSAIDAIDAPAVMSENWEADADVAAAERGPLAGPTFPGLVDTADWAVVDDWAEQASTWVQAPRTLGLVATTRGADVPAVVGWLGPANHHDPATVSAMLRSWEDRFGAVAIEIGFDTLLLAVRKPPTTMDEALRVTAEHEAFCSDNLWQGVGDYETYAQQIVHSPGWMFWWD